LSRGFPAICDVPELWPTVVWGDISTQFASVAFRGPGRNLSISEE